MGSLFDGLPEATRSEPRRWQYPIVSCNLCTRVVDGELVWVVGAHDGGRHTDLGMYNLAMAIMLEAARRWRGHAYENGSCWCVHCRG